MRRTYTDLECQLLWLVSDLVRQGAFRGPEDAYSTGFIGIYKDAMMTLVEHGLMTEIQDGFGRVYVAKFVDPPPKLEVG